MKEKICENCGFIQPKENRDFLFCPFYKTDPGKPCQYFTTRKDIRSIKL